MEKLILTAAIVGAEVTRGHNPNLPISPEEIAAATFECYEAGAAVVHLHVRNPDGSATQNVDLYEKTIGLIAKRCDIIIQVSTGGAVGMSREERIGPVSLRPEMATLTTGTVNFGEDVFLNYPADIVFFAQTMQRYGVKPEIEVFDAGMIGTAIRLVRQGLITPPLHFDFVLGVPGGMAGTPKNLLHLVDAIPANSTWSVAGIGKAELPLGVLAIILGGHVRVGFEDNIFFSSGVLAASNAQLVERMARISREMGREVANPTEAKRILGLCPA